MMTDGDLARLMAARTHYYDVKVLAANAAGFVPAVKSVWLAEGILGYLAMDQAERLMAEAARQGSRLSVAGTPPGDWLPRNGWDPEATTLSSWARQQGRNASGFADESSGGGRMWLIAARGRAVSGKPAR